MKARKPKDIASFNDWLIARGAIVDAPTNEWEILRVRTCDGVFVAYRNKAGKETWPEDLLDLREAFEAGRALALSPDLKSRKRSRHLIEALGERDGLKCWFCDLQWQNPENANITIEHLVPVCHGGPNHMSNLVLACQACNGAVGNMPVAKKVIYREQQRLPA